MTTSDRNYYKSQASKRLKLVYKYAQDDLESGTGPDAYGIFRIAKVDILSIFTSPERSVWRDIRVWGRGLSFYPEYPIGDDIVDFVDPCRKIAIEVDTARHSKDKDDEKDRRVGAEGYQIIRIDRNDTKPDIGDILKTYNFLKESGKIEEAKKFKKGIRKNSETIIQELRNKFESVNFDEDDIKIVRLGDMIKTEKFKAYFSKYVKNIPEDLVRAIEEIDLNKSW